LVVHIGLSDFVIQQESIFSQQMGVGREIRFLLNDTSTALSVNKRLGEQHKTQSFPFD
jgi:hypothetical protein